MGPRGVVQTSNAARSGLARTLLPHLSQLLPQNAAATPMPNLSHRAAHIGTRRRNLPLLRTPGTTAMIAAVIALFLGITIITVAARYRKPPAHQHLSQLRGRQLDHEAAESDRLGYREG